ncbi:MAG: hypothetical protein A2487_02340, partial [Candidatus Raymondbacteria bacterium RifOxyC12_full_50_8]
MNKCTISIDKLFDSLPVAKWPRRSEGLEARNQGPAESTAIDQPVANDFSVTLRKNIESNNSQDPKVAVANENKASTQAAQVLGKSIAGTTKIDQKIDETAESVKKMLEKLGITVSAETLAEPGVAKQLLALLKNFLEKINSGETQQPMANDDLAGRISELLGNNTDVSVESMAALLTGLKETLTELKNLVDLKDFVVENSKGEETGAIPIASSIQDTPAADASAQTSDQKPETDAPGEQTQESAVSIPQTSAAVVETSDETNTDKAKAMQSGTQKPQPETEVPLVQEQDTEEKTTIADNPAPTAEETSDTQETAKQEKPEIIEAVLTAVQAKNLIKETAGKHEKTDTHVAPEQTEERASPAVAEKKQAVATPQETAADLLKQEPETKQETSEEKNPFIKDLAALKEAIANAVTAPRTEPQQSAPAEILAARANYNAATANTHEKDIVGQIISRFQLFKGANGSEINIQLKPEHLGQVRISLDIERNIVFARMQVENENVKHIVENNVQSLKTALEESGIKVERFEVTVASGDDGNNFFRRDLA